MTLWKLNYWRWFSDFFPSAQLMRTKWRLFYVLCKLHESDLHLQQFSSLCDLAFDTLSENKAENELSQLIWLYIKFYLYHNDFISSFRKVYHKKKKVCGLFLTATDIFIFEYFLWIQIIKFQSSWSSSGCGESVWHCRWRNYEPYAN